MCEKNCYSSKITERGSSKQKCLLKIKESILLSCSSDDTLVSKFRAFFMRKAAEIRDITDADDPSRSETVVILLLGQLICQSKCWNTYSQ